jgi:WD40 repeat protein
MLATCSGLIHLWEVSTGKLLREVEGRFWPTGSLVFSPNGQILAAQREKEICLVNPATGKVFRRLAVEPLSRAFAFSPDGKLLATSGPSAKAGGSYSVSLWSLATGRQVSVLWGHRRPVYSAAFTPDGRTLVSASLDNRICHYEVGTGNLQKSFDLPLPEGRTACLSPDGRTLAVASPWPAQPGADDTLWSTETGKRFASIPSRRETESCYGLAFSPDGKVLATDAIEAGTDRATISLWKVADGKRITSFPIPARAAFVLNFAPDGRTLLSSGPEPQVRLWNTSTGKQLLPPSGHEGAICTLSFTPDARTLLSGADDGKIAVWDVATAQLRRQLTGHRCGVCALTVSRDSKTVLSGGADGCLRLHELDTGRLRRRFVLGSDPEKLRQPEQHVLSLGLTAGGQAVSWSFHFIRKRSLFHVWDLRTGKALTQRTDGGAGRCLFSPDGKLVLTRTDAGAVAPGTEGGDTAGSSSSRGLFVPFAPAEVVLQEVTTGRRVLSLPQPDFFGSVQAFAPDGRSLVTATGKVRGFAGVPSDGHALHVWDLATGKERRTIRSGETSTWCCFEHLAVAPDGRTLATIRADQTIQLWDLTTGKEVLRHAGSSARTCCLGFSPDGRTLATGHADSTILLWDMTSRPAPRKR